MFKKIFLCFLLCLFIFPVFSDDISIEKYEELLLDYEELLNDYEEQISDYDQLLKEYILLTEKFVNLSNQHEIDIKIYGDTKLSLMAANEVIEKLELSVKQLLSIVDTKYFAVYLQVGYIGNTFGVGFTAQYPKLPVSLMVDLNYIYSLEYPVDIQIGIGFRF